MISWTIASQTFLHFFSLSLLYIQLPSSSPSSKFIQIYLLETNCVRARKKQRVRKKNELFLVGKVGKTTKEKKNLKIEEKYCMDSDDDLRVFFFLFSRRNVCVWREIDKIFVSHYSESLILLLLYYVWCFDAKCVLLN